MNTFQYKGYTITVQKVETRFGTLFLATNNFGEPYLDVPAFKTEDEALLWDMKNIDAILSGPLEF